MKKKKLLPIFLLIVGALASCSDEAASNISHNESGVQDSCDTSSGSSTQSSTNTPTPTVEAGNLLEITKYNGFTLDNDTYKANVSSSVTDYNVGNIVLADNATFKIYEDEGLTKEVINYNVTLNDFDNNYFLKITSANGKNTKTYKINIYRTIKCNVSIDNNNGEELKSLEVESGEFNIPAPSKDYYNFKGYSVDGNLVTFPYNLTKDTQFKAEYEPLDELKDFKFKITDNEFIITGLNNPEIKNVVIPSYVTSIGSTAFMGAKLESITLPKNIIIYEKAFLNTNIKNVYYEGTYRDWFEEKLYGESSNPKSLDGSFYYKDNNSYTKLTEFVCPTDITEIKDNLFQNFTEFKSIKLTDNILTVGSGAFAYCHNNKELVLGDKLKTIKENAFRENRGIWELELPNTLETIGSNAFRDSIGLIRVKIGTKFPSIYTEAFRGCEKLYEVCNLSDRSLSAGGTANGHLTYRADSVVKTDTTAIVNIDGYLFGRRYSSMRLLGYIGNDNNLALPGSVNGETYYIGDYAFAYRDDIYSVKAINGVEEVGWYAFEYCSNLKSFNSGSLLNTYANYAFYNCTSLTDISTLSPKLTFCGNSFEGCTSLKDVIIPGGYNFFGGNVFNGCTSLNSIKLEEGIETLGPAFVGCNNLSYMILPKSLKTINDNTFKDLNNVSIFYAGTKSDKDSITIKTTGNTGSNSPTWYYYSETKPIDNIGEYWHYVDGKPVIWS